MFVAQSSMYNDIRAGNFNYNAFVDPNDPSHVYVKQPQMWIDRPDDSILFIRFIADINIMIERTLNRKNQTHLQQTYHDMFNKHRGMSPFDRLKVDGQHQKNR